LPAGGAAAARGAVLAGSATNAALAILRVGNLLFKLLGGRGAPSFDFSYYEIGSSFFTFKTSSLANDYGRHQ